MDKAGVRRGPGKLLEILARYKYVLAVVALGALLLMWPGGRDAGEGGASGADRSEAELPAAVGETEAAMEEILGRIQGVGRVEVMLTLQSGSELVLAEDTSLNYSGSAQAPDDYQRSSKSVIADDGVVVRQEKYPQYRGALVVCDGGGSDAVRLKVVEAVAALTGLGADRISVAQWRRGDGQDGTFS